MPTDTGIFTPEEAVTGHAFSYRLAEYIGENFDKKLAIYDIGCGPGTYLKYLIDIGFHEVTGIEGTKKLEYEVPRSMVVNVDLTKPLKLHRNQGNVICIEVGEHIPKEFEQVFIDNICSQLKRTCFLVLSWAHEGQQGYGHVNCLPDWKVLQEFEKRGLKYDEHESLNLRSIIEGHVAYLRENLFVFKKL